MINNITQINLTSLGKKHKYFIATPLLLLLDIKRRISSYSYFTISFFGLLSFTQVHNSFLFLLVTHFGLEFLSFCELYILLKFAVFLSKSSSFMIYLGILLSCYLCIYCIFLLSSSPFL